MLEIYFLALHFRKLPTPGKYLGFDFGKSYTDLNRMAFAAVLPSPHHNTTATTLSFIQNVVTL